MTFILQLLGLHICLLIHGGMATEPDYYDREPQSISERIIAVNMRVGEFLIDGDIIPHPRGNPWNVTAQITKWKKNSRGKVVVPYIIGNMYSPSEKDMIVKAMKSFAPRTCIHFTSRTNEKDFIEILSKPDKGCSSHVGRIGGKQTVHLKRYGCMQSGIIQHELIHALGFYHEQSRKDRDNFVRINWDNIKETHKYNFKKYDFFKPPTRYDYSSIMHYGRKAFSRNGKDTITPIPDSSVKIGQRDGMSQLDIKKVNMFYACRKQVSIY